MLIYSAQMIMAATIEENVATIVRLTEAAGEKGAEIVLFPELAVTGYDHHLHEFWRRPDWEAEVQRGLDELHTCAADTGVTILVGAPSRTGAGCEDAVLQIGCEGVIRQAGSKMLLGVGEKPWFVPGVDKHPVEIRGTLVGFAVCREGAMASQLRGTGLEESEVILWPCGLVPNEVDGDGTVVVDKCRLGGQALAREFGAPVIQSTYLSRPSGPPPPDRVYGGSVIVSCTGEVLQQAPFAGECLLRCDLADLNRTSAG